MKNKAHYQKLYGSYFLIETETGSIYAVNLEEGLIVRNPNQVETGVKGFPLRKDGDTTRLLEIDNLEVGKPVHFLLTGVAESENVATLRTTSHVTKIISF